MSVTTFRLGSSRYMRCPLCRRFGLFSLRRSKADDRPASLPPIAPSLAGGGDERARSAPSTTSAAPRFNDRRPMVRWGLLLILPAAALILFGVLLALPTMTELLLATAVIVVLGVGLALLLGFSRPDRVS